MPKRQSLIFKPRRETFNYRRKQGLLAQRIKAYNDNPGNMPLRDSVLIGAVFFVCIIGTVVRWSFT